MSIRTFLSVVASLCIATFCQAQSNNPVTAQSKSISKTENQPVEIGLVKWGRDLDSALAQSKQSGKPVLVLFQEVPGCAGCQKFGRQVLSDPLIVEAFEDEFIPIVVYNNRSSGRDSELMKRFKEPAWNYQVVRFLNADGEDVIARQDGIWSIEGIAARMGEALEAVKRPTPKYIKTLTAVGSTEDHEKAAFSMSCFWTGEYELGNIDGVVGTEAGWLDGHEVTLVEFDKSKLSLKSLASQAAQVRCANKVYTAEGQSLGRLPGGKLTGYRAASMSDQNKQISSWSALAEVPGINEMQLTKINAQAPRNQQAALDWLSPRQKEFFVKAMSQ